jgi:Na+/H+ antiporter NhaD/arsenite permease-like protein
MKTLVIFLLTYGGIAFRRFPRLVIDRTEIALLGAIAMVMLGALKPEAAFASIHVGT